MINDFDNYKKIKKLLNYMIFLNSKLIGNFIFLLFFLDGLDYLNIIDWFFNNYKIYKSNLFK